MVPSIKLLQYVYASNCSFLPVIISRVVTNTKYEDFSLFYSYKQHLNQTSCITAYYIAILKRLTSHSLSVRCKVGTKTTLSTLSLWITASCQSPEKCTYSFWYSGEMIYPVAGTKILNFMSCIKGKPLKNKFTPYSNFCISQSGPGFLLTYIYKTCRAVYYRRYWFPKYSI